MALNLGNILAGVGGGVKGYQQAQLNNSQIQNNNLINQNAMQEQQASQIANSVLGNLFNSSSGNGQAGPSAPIIPSNIGINQPQQQPSIPSSLGSIIPQQAGGGSPPQSAPQQPPSTGGPVNLYQGPGQPSVLMGSPQSQPAAASNATPQNLPGQQFAKSPSQALATPSAQSAPLSNMDMQQLPGMLAKEINKIPNISPQQKGAAFIMALTKLQPMIQAQQAQQFKEQQLKLAQDRLSEKEQYDNQMMDIRGRLADVTAQKANSAETGKAKGALSSDALDFLSDRILSGDKSAAAGMGYGSVGASNRAALQEAVAAKAKERGMSGQELSNINAEYGGTQAGERTIGQRQANVDMFANEAKTMGNILRQQSKDFDRSDFVPLANGEVALAKNTNDPKAVKYVTALNSYINAYAKATNGGAAATVDSKVAARDSLMSGYSDTGIQAALDVNDQELDAALQAPGQVKKEFRNNGKDTQTPAAPASDNIVHWDDLK